MPNQAEVTMAVTIRGQSWTSTQNRDILTAAHALIKIHPKARVNNLAVTASPQGRRSTMKFRLEQEL